MKAEMPSPGVSLPGPFDTLPSPVLPVETPWLRTSVENAEFEQKVLNEHGLAQVGFGMFHLLSVPHRLFTEQAPR